MKYVMSAENIKYSTVRHNLLHHRSIVLDHMILVTLLLELLLRTENFLLS